MCDCTTSICNCSSTEVPTGSDGLNGYNAYTRVATQLNGAFVADNTTNYTVTVKYDQVSQDSGKWAITGQIIYIESIGYVTVVSSTSTTITFKIPLAATGYNNSLPANLVVGKKISPAGLIGPTGTIATQNLVLIDDEVGYSTTGTIVQTLGPNVPTSTFTIPANTFVTDQDIVMIEALVYTNDPTSNATTKNITLEANGTNLMSGSANYPTILLGKTLNAVRFNVQMSRQNTTANIGDLYYKTRCQTEWEVSGSNIAYIEKSFEVGPIIFRSNLSAVDFTAEITISLRADSIVTGDLKLMHIYAYYIPKI